MQGVLHGLEGRCVSSDLNGKTHPRNGVRFSYGTLVPMSHVPRPLPSSTRSPELDLARLTAMLMMVAYHLAFDLSYFYGWDMDLASPGWRLLQRTTLTLFLLINGISAAVSSRRRSANVQPERRPAPFGFAGQARVARRSLILFTYALAITLVTFMFFPEEYIRFGVLHCIALTGLLLPLFLPLRLWNAALGIGLLFLGAIVRTWTTGTSLLLPLGLPPPGFQSLDYVPMLPWSGVILLGAALGHLLYVQGLRPPEMRLPQWLVTLSIPGRSSLAFYLVHQPVLLAILAILFGPPRFS